MKFSIVALSCVILAAGSAPAVNTIRSTKSNASYKEAAPCTTPACCIQHPNANGCVGSLLKSQANLPRHPRDCGEVTGENCRPSVTTSPKNSGHASEKTTTIINTKSNGSLKEAAPTPAASTTTPKNSGHASEKTTTVNTSKSNTFKEAEPTPAASTTTPKNSGHASEKTMTINSTKGSTFKTAAIKSTKSNASFKEAKPTPGVTPTPKPAEKNINLNSSRTNY
jgi:hypothetical protein